MYRVLRSSRIPLFLHRKSNHVFTMWQHLVLLAIRQYEGKSYRMSCDSEDNHLFVRDELHAFSVIPARYEHIPIWRTYGKYRKQMKRGYSRLLYNQRNKDETIDAESYPRNISQKYNVKNRRIVC